jgi:general secretion pathway protein B
MSAILEALKKLDREKSLRGSRTPDIGTEILKAVPSRSGKKIWAYLAVVIVLTATLTYAAFVRFGASAKSTPSGAVSAPVQGQVVSSPSATPAPKSLPSVSVSSRPAGKDVFPSRSLSGPKAPVSPPAPSSQPLQEVSASPAQPAPTATLSPPKPEQVSPPPPPPEPARAAQDDPALVRPKAESAGDAQNPPTAGAEKRMPQPIMRGLPEKADKPPKASVAESLTIKITGIVWSQEPTERLAVINGVTVTEGETIEGVKVVEILPSRVRFLDDTSPFEILLGSASVIRH